MSSLKGQHQRVIRRSDEIDFRLSVGMGRQDGFKSLLVIGNTFGQSTADGVKTIWDQDTSLVRLTSDTELFLSSTDAADVGIIVLVHVVNEAFEYMNNIVILNGQNQVSVGLSGILIQSATVVGPIEPLGDIFAAPSTALTNGKPSDTDTIQSKIIQGQNTTHNGFAIVPKGFNGITMVSRGNTGSINKVAKLATRFAPPGAVFVSGVNYSLTVNMFEIEFPIPIGVAEFFGESAPLLPEGIFIEFCCSVDSNDTDVFFGTDFLLARKEKFAIVSP